MVADTLTGARPGAFSHVRPELTILRRAARQVRRGALASGVLFGAVVGGSMSTYASILPTAAERQHVVETLGRNTGLAAVFGTTHRLDTVQGYTAYKSGTFCVLGAALWGLLAATKAFRGEEDAGRWELLLAGQTTRRGAALQAMTGLGSGLVWLGLPLLLLAGAAGRDPAVQIGLGTCLFYTVAIVAAAGAFMAVGAAASQVAGSRRGANLLGGGVLALSYLIRVVADSGVGLEWLRWVTPLGWVEELRPLTGSHPLAFVPLVLLTGGLAAVAVRLAAVRDLGGRSLVPVRRARSRLGLLSGQGAFAVRENLTAAVAWTTGLALFSVVLGLVAPAAGDALAGNTGVGDVIHRLGGTRSGTAAYLGVACVMVAAIVAAQAAALTSAMRAAESAGQLEAMLVRPVSRARWLLARLAVALGSVLLTGVVAGTATWAGAASQDAGVSLTTLLGAGLNASAPAVFVVGLGVLAFGVLPRATSAVAFGIVIWSLLVQSVSSTGNGQKAMAQTSIFLHIAPVPAASLDWVGAGWLVALGLLGALLGLVRFARRDLQAA